ncbi:MAG: hypothetical protein EHM91_00095 [Planctomycetota bacterium]|nr:MAG: hypothetical protein EHM91_00095 [Planctomycetota bacterium]
MCPDYKAECERLAQEYPEAFRNAHTGNAQTEDFVRIVAAHLYALDDTVGLNGKRGNPADISDDAINILDPEDGPGTTPTGERCWVVDFIASAGAPNASITWNPIPDAVGSSGAWVEPGPPPDTGDQSAISYPYPDEPTTGRAYQDRVHDTYEEAGREFPDPADPDAFRHFMRYGYSCRYMPEPEAADKHIAELRADLGLPAAAAS